MKKMTEKEIVKKALEIWHGVVYNYRDGKKLNKADLNKVMSAYQKLVLLDLEDAGRHYDVAYYFMDNVFGTTELDLATVKKYIKFFDGIKRVNFEEIKTYNSDLEIERKNWNTVKEAGITLKMYYLAEDEF